MEDLYLIYVNRVGDVYNRKTLYEFIFSDTDDPKKIDGDEWDTYPASGRPEPPHDIFIKKVGRLESDFILDVIQNSDTFAVWDAIDGVLPLAWENINSYDAYPDKRLHFHFGLTLKEVEDILYEKDLRLEFNTQLHGKEK